MLYPLISFLLVLNCFIPVVQSHWGSVVDAGSSGCRLRIYQWGVRYTSETDPNITEYIPTNKTDAAALENRLPISSYASNPQDIGNSLVPLINQAKRWIPQDQWSTAPLILRATAGMRLLDTVQQNAVFNAIRAVFKDTTKNPFKFEDNWATIASGEQEAVWSWVMANYVSGYLKPNTTWSQYISTLELGGASVQIEFIPTDELLSNRYDIMVFGKNIPLYAQSFLEFGKDRWLVRARGLAAKNSPTNTTIEFPCFYVGYTDSWVNSADGKNYTFVGTGNWDGCYTNYTTALMGLDVPCIQGPCSFYGVYQPKLPTTQSYWGVSGYFYTLNGIGQVGYDAEWTGVVADFLPNAMAQCAKSWTKAQADLNTTSPTFVATYCFDATVVVALLRNQKADLIPISYARKKYGQTVGWPLGALIDGLNLLPLDLIKLNMNSGMMQAQFSSITLIVLVCVWFGLM